MFTTKEIRLLQSFRYQDAYLVQVASAICYGLSLPVFVYSTVLFYKKGLTSTPMKLMTLIGLTCFILSTQSLIGNTLFASVVMSSPRSLALGSGDLVGVQRRWLRGTWFGSSWASWFETIALNASDAVVVWRASVLFQPRPVAFWGLYFLLGASIAVSLYAPSIYQTNFNRYLTLDLHAQNVISTMNCVSGYLSLGTNVLATGAIGWKFWDYKSFMRKNGLKVMERSSSVKKVLVVLFETGILFCFFQATSVILQQVTVQVVDDEHKAVWFTPTLAIGNFTALLSAVYPLIVTVLVYSRNSVVDDYKIASLAVCDLGDVGIGIEGEDGGR